MRITLLGRAVPLLALLTALHGGVLADEGMWPFNRFPVEDLAARHGFTASPQWLGHLQASTLRLANGCSASLVSSRGLVMTNHHCARGCVAALSGLSKQDFEQTGFLARSGGEELRCPGLEANQLQDISDVTARVQAATQDLDPAQFAAAQRSAIAAIERECASSDAVRCEVISLYRGGRYDLYRFRRLPDVRLAFAPEARIGAFGGDPDNFNFPRYALDMALLRVYGPEGQPLATPQHLAWSTTPAREGELSFVVGNPGGTSRGYTLAQIEADRDQALPASLTLAAELRGFLAAYQDRGPVQRRHASDALGDVENWLKATRGQHAALADRSFLRQLADQEAAWRAQTAARPDLQAAYGDVWDQIATIVARQRQQAARLAAFGGGGSPLYGTARTLVRYADEADKPNGERLAEFSDARLPEIRQALLSPRPQFAEFEIARLAFWLTRLREALGADDPLVQRLFARHSPAQLARNAVRGTRLGELRADAQGRAVGGYRKVLLDGGPAVIRASRDPMLELARLIDPDARAARKLDEDSVQGPLRQQEERLARLRFALAGDGGYPDATFTPRISWGTVRGWQDGPRQVVPFTTLGGAFARHTGAEPFALPASWLRAKARLALDTHFNFTSDHDIIGGNSGSPVVNTQGEVVGLVFDGNIHSLGGEYGFDAALNRTVSVDATGMLEVLDKVYGAGRLVGEIVAP